MHAPRSKVITHPPKKSVQSFNSMSSDQVSLRVLKNTHCNVVRVFSFAPHFGVKKKVVITQSCARGWKDREIHQPPSAVKSIKYNNFDVFISVLYP